MKKPGQVIRIMVWTKYPIGVNIPAGLKGAKQDRAIEAKLKKYKEQGRIREVVKWERTEESDEQRTS